MADNLRPLSVEAARARREIVCRARRPGAPVRIPDLGMYPHIRTYEELLPFEGDEPR